jgi:hypothetical protein
LWHQIKDAGYRSLMGVRVKARDQVLALQFWSKQPNAFEQQHVAVARRIVDHVALAVSHEQLAQLARGVRTEAGRCGGGHRASVDAETTASIAASWSERSVLEFAEHLMVANGSGAAGQGSQAKLTDHEHVLRDVVLTPKGQLRRRRKTEPPVVRRVPQYNHRGCVELPAPVEAFPNQNPLPLSRRHDRHGSEPHQQEIGVVRECHWGEQDVPDDRRVVVSNQRNHLMEIIRRAAAVYGF